MTSSIVTWYRFDADGWYISPVTVQIIDGAVLAPRTATPTPIPEADEEANFFKWDGTEWEVIPKPKTLEDFEGVAILHETQTKHDQEMRQILQDLLREDKTGKFREGRTDELGWYASKVTPEEEEANAVQSEVSAIEERVRSIKDRMALAMLKDDQETIKALRHEYAALMVAPTSVTGSAAFRMARTEERFCDCCGAPLDAGGNCTGNCPICALKRVEAEKRKKADEAREAQKAEAEAILAAEKAKPKPFAE